MQEWAQSLQRLKTEAKEITVDKLMLAHPKFLEVVPKDEFLTEMAKNPTVFKKYKKIKQEAFIESVGKISGIQAPQEETQDGSQIIKTI